MRSTMLIGLLVSLHGIDAAIAAGTVLHTQAGIAGKDEKGRVFTKEQHIKEAWKHAEAAPSPAKKATPRAPANTRSSPRLMWKPL